MPRPKGSKNKVVDASAASYPQYIHNAAWNFVIIAAEPEHFEAKIRALVPLTAQIIAVTPLMSRGGNERIMVTFKP